MARLMASKLLNMFSRAHIPTILVSPNYDQSNKELVSLLTKLFHPLILRPPIRWPLIDHLSHVLKPSCDHPLLICMRRVDLSTKGSHTRNSSLYPIIDRRVLFECAVFRLVGEADVDDFDPSSWVEVSVTWQLQ